MTVEEAKAELIQIGKRINEIAQAINPEDDYFVVDIVNGALIIHNSGFKDGYPKDKSIDIYRKLTPEVAHA